MTEPYDCAFHCFKESGKWYASGRGRYPRPNSMGEYWPVTRYSVLYENNTMPRLNSDGAEFIVVVVPDDDCTINTAHPALLPIGSE